MKLLSLLFVSSVTLAAQAFGVTPTPSVTKSAGASQVAFFPESALRKSSSAVASPLFRTEAALKTRGGAIKNPWAAYNDALDDHPLTTKAFTSLVGWALGDALSQVRGAQPECAALFVETIRNSSPTDIKVGIHMDTAIEKLLV
jgi:hypothetical protein